MDPVSKLIAEGNRDQMIAEWLESDETAAFKTSIRVKDESDPTVPRNVTVTRQGDDQRVKSGEKVLVRHNVYTKEET